MYFNTSDNNNKKCEFSSDEQKQIDAAKEVATKAERLIATYNIFIKEALEIVDTAPRSIDEMLWLLNKKLVAEDECRAKILDGRKKLDVRC